MFVLDTNTLIYALKGIGRIRERLVGVRPGDITIPAIVAYEMEFGTLHSNKVEKRRRDLDHLFGMLAILPFDGRAANRAARLRHELESAGEKIGPLDMLIAGTVTRETQRVDAAYCLHVEFVPAVLATAGQG